MTGWARLWWGFLKRTFEQGSSISRMALGSGMNQRHSSGFLFISFRGEFFVLAWANCWLWQLLCQKGHWLVSKQGGGENLPLPLHYQSKSVPVSPLLLCVQTSVWKRYYFPLYADTWTELRVCNASALAFNLQPELIGLIHRQQTELFMQWLSSSGSVWYMALMEW